MRARVDSMGRIVIPRPMREALGISAGSVVNVSRCGDGLHLMPEGGTARLVDEDGRLVAESDTIVTDEIVFDLIGPGRR